jgi:heme A synthase
VHRFIAMLIGFELLFPVNLLFSRRPPRVLLLSFMCGLVEY